MRVRPGDMGRLTWISARFLEMPNLTIWNVASRSRPMTPDFEVRKTTATLAGKPVPVVHVLRDDGNGGTEMVRIPCPDSREQDRIAAELDALLKAVDAKA